MSATTIMSIILENLLAYLINLASGERSAAIAATRERKLKEALEQEESIRKSLVTSHSLREEIRNACAHLARNRIQLGVSPKEEPLWRLLGDDVFQADTMEWLMAGGIVEGNAAKERMIKAMETALISSGATVEQITFLRSDYFETLEKAVFSNPTLAHWRHQLSLDYLRGQVSELKRHAQEAAGVYSERKQKAALDRYCEKALAAWDIIDLSNLPEPDIELATQKLLLRQLYMPLRVSVESSTRAEGHDAALGRLEQERETRRYREAGRDDGLNGPNTSRPRSPIGERLAASRRLVILGDPGGGKTTMLRWMATAYLLRYNEDKAFREMPDTETLPNQSWIPVLIRCRDLGEADLCRCFTDFLTQHLYKTELLPDEADVMRTVILARIAKGEALLMVDGLDEITNPQVRMMFCQELERTATRYPDAYIVVTSRIVGYRDMPYRMGSGFCHGIIAELSNGDKDVFAQRWVDVTEQHQPSAEKSKRVQELLQALHSSDRIERLTGNPMLLTTLALVKRKVGKLPNRRNKLYAEAVSVLLNWNPRLYKAIEEDEAIPQLEYLAYEMCRQGVQRLTDDEVINLLDRLRTEYPNIRVIRRREPQAFLELLEARSSILIKSGSIWQKNKSVEKPVWEFRHLTFQEYLAARALLDGRYPGRDKAKTLAEQVAPLAGVVEQPRTNLPAKKVEPEIEVPESWREALRLLVADCKDDDVDDVLLAILNPLNGEDASKTARPRTVLAALCLADEPNVSEQTAERVLHALIGRIADKDGRGLLETTLDKAAVEIGSSLWEPLLKKRLMEEFCRVSEDKRWNVGGLWGASEVKNWSRFGVDPQTGTAKLSARLKSKDRYERISAAVAIMDAAYEGKITVGTNVAKELINCISPQDLPLNHAATWALSWLSTGSYFQPGRKGIWIPDSEDVDLLCAALASTAPNEPSTRRWLAVVLGASRDPRALQPLLGILADPVLDVRRAVVEALGNLGDKQAVEPLLRYLDDSDQKVRYEVIEALGNLGDKQAVEPLLRYLDDSESQLRYRVVGALAKLRDPKAVESLLQRLDDSESQVRRITAATLGNLGDKQAVEPLLRHLDDSDQEVRRNIVEALGKLGDKQAIDPLLRYLDDQDAEVCVLSAAALVKLKDTRGTTGLKQFLTSRISERRQNAVRELARGRSGIVKSLLSEDLDAVSPWLDPAEPITQYRVAECAKVFRISEEEVRAHYKAIADDFGLTLTW